MNDPHRPDEPEDDASDREGEARQSPEPGRGEEETPADDSAAAGPTPGESGASGPDEPAPDESAPETAGGDASGQEESTPEHPPAEADTAAEGGAGETAPAGGDTAGDDDGTDGGSGRAGLAAGITALVLALLGLAGGGGWLGWRLQQLEQRLEQVPQERSEALAEASAPLARKAALDDAVSRLEGEIERLASQGSEATRAVAGRVDELEAAVKTVRELAGRRQVDWRMAEVHYLLSLAARRLAIAGDRSAAIAALEATDRSVAALGDVRLVELRRAILDDITALRQVEPADVEGIALRIQSLLERVPDLPPATATVTAAADDNGDGGTGGADGPRAWWESIKQRLSQYVVIRRQPDGGAPARPQRDVSLPAAEKLAFALAEARRAALRHDSDAYGAAVARARKLVDENFAADTPVVRRFADALAALSERAVVTTYPDLTTTLEQAEQAAARLRSQRERPPEAEPEEG